MDELQSGNESPNEVKQLQDLVKKLERQNELLRNKQTNLIGQEKTKGNVIISSDSTAIDVTCRVPNSYSHNRNNRNSFAGLDDSVVSLDDVDVLDFDRLSLEDEEDSWLYVSPNKFGGGLSQRPDVNPYEFVRQDLDAPGCNLELAKKSLKTKLDSVSKYGASSPYSNKHRRNILSPTSAAIPVGVANHTVSSPNMNRKIPAAPGIKPPILSLSGSRLNTNAYTRLKKVPSSSGTSSMSRIGAGFGYPLKSPLDDQKENMAETQPVSDIQVLAKLQEESLRQSFSAKESPFASPRRSSGGLQPMRKISPGSPFGSNRSSPARADSLESPGLTATNHHSHYDHAASSGSQDSMTSGSDAQYGSQEMEHGSPLTGGMTADTRRSLPNLSRGAHSPPKRTSSDPHIDDDCDSGDSGRLTDHPAIRHKSPSHPAFNRPLSPSMSRLKRPNHTQQRTISPHRSGLPTPVKTGIPRPPSGRSSLPTPMKRSNIPSPMSKQPVNAVANNGDPGDDSSWMEGCF